MDQLGLFYIPEIDAYEKIKPALLEVLFSNGLTEEYLSIEEKKSYFSICFRKSSVIVRIRGGKKPRIEIPDGCDYRKIPLSNLGEIHDFVPEIKDSLESVINNIAKEFDCCHLFEKCSNEKVCVHQNKDFALMCGYRKILKSGRIFYGDNRNV